MYLSVLNQLKSVDNPTSLLVSIRENTNLINRLNESSELGNVICRLILRSFGLGIKNLIQSGLDLTASDVSTEDTPLLVVCNEGLCGPTQQLIEFLPWQNLMHKNKCGLTALTQLLVRAHALCGCLRKLIIRIPTCELILPDNLLLSHANIHSNKGTQLLLPLSDLLNSIRTNDISKILGVVDLWIELNLLLFIDFSFCEQNNKYKNYGDQLELNANAIENYLVNPFKSNSNGNRNSQNIVNDRSTKDSVIQDNKTNLIVFKLEYVLLQLFILGHIDKNFVSNQYNQGDDSFLCRLFGEIINRLSTPLCLRQLVVRKIRSIFQTKFINACLSSANKRESRTIDNASLFFTWVDQLPIPWLLKRFIYLENI